MNKEKEIEEMAEVFRAANQRANVEPVFEDENGQEHYLPQEAIKVIEDILGTLFIPFLANVAIEAGYRIADEVREETVKSIWEDFKLQRNHFDDWEWEVIKLICRTNGVKVDESCK